MNLVERINTQLSDAVTAKLGSLIGEGAGKTRSVLEAAVPSLLTGILLRAWLLAQPDGKRRGGAETGSHGWQVASRAGWQVLVKTVQRRLD